MADNQEPHNRTDENQDNWIARWFASLLADRLTSSDPQPAVNSPQAQHARARQQATISLAARLLPYDASATATGMANAEVQFCVEDTVGLKDDKFMVGAIDRSFGDVDSHEPRPQREYSEDIERHSDIPRDEFQKFMKTGIPPRGTVLVSWQTVLKTELIPESQLELLDRALYVGDVVKRNAKDHMSGTVIGTKAFCTLFPAAHFNGDLIPHSIMEELSIRQVPASELLNVHEYVEGALVIYDDWVGRIDEVSDEVAVKLSNNSVVVVEYSDELEPVDPLTERLSVGDTVKTKKGNLRRGRWRYGAFDPNVRPQGMVVETRTTAVEVRWLARRFGALANTPNSGDEPPTSLDREDLESGRFHVYDATSAAASTLPRLENGIDRSYHVADVSVADRVRFKDLTGAAVKYDGTHTLPNGYNQGKLSRISRTETLGYDMNVYTVMQTRTQVTVQWQDLSITEDPSPLLIPDPNVEDDDEVWPGEIVCTKEERKDKTVDASWCFEPAKVGVVQAVKSRDRIATVRWFENASIQFLGDDLIPPSETGRLREDSEDVSLYDIRSTPSLTRRRGDFVLVHPSLPDRSPNTDGPDWFGEVVDLGLDGKVTVRLGAAKPVIDVRIPAERVTLVYSSDMENHFDFMPTIEGESDEDSEEGSDFDSESFNEMWIEYEGMDGEPIGDLNDEDWSTEDEDENSDDDDSMPDLEPLDDIDTSKTTPEAHSESEPKSPMIIDSPPMNVSTASQHVASNPRTTENHTASISKPAENATQGNVGAPEAFMILDTAPPSSHHYVYHASTSASSSFMKRITKEHKILRSSLPPGILVRTWESRLDLIRVLMIGPSDTPYEYAPFMIDFHLPSSYPYQAPEAFFHSWTNGNGPVNPNLYEDGKICLSLLGTWHADERNESWSPTKSTLLQVLVSIMGLVLVKEPYYNEAGYDIHREAPETKLSSALYTERAHFRARAFIVHALTENVEPFAEELKYFYLSKKEGAPRLLEKATVAAKDILERSEKGEDVERDGLRRISLGAVVMLQRQLAKLEELMAQMK